MKAFAGRVLILEENGSVPSDTRVWLEATTLTEKGYKVTVICPKGTELDFKRYEIINNVTIYRYKCYEAKSNFLSYGLEYCQAILKITLFSVVVFFREGFDVIQICNPPDLLFLVTIPYKLFGKKIIFDHHDLCPELYLAKKGNHKINIVFRILLLLEKLTFKTANVVMSTNEFYKKIATSRGQVDRNKVIVVRNGPELRKFRNAEKNLEPRHSKGNQIVYVGQMSQQDGVDYLLRSIDYIIHYRKRSDLHVSILGGGTELAALKRYTHELKIDKFVTFTGPVLHSVVIEALYAADIGLCPDPKNPLNDLSTLVKTMEYMVAGLPIVAFSLKETKTTSGDAALYAKPNNEKDFGDKIIKLLDSPDLREKLGKIGKERVIKSLCWEHSKNNLFSAYKLAIESSSWIDSFSKKIYYHIKYILPRRIQITLRRFVIARNLPLVSHVWPIDETTIQPSEEWLGWPDQKKFALVLTHDVEGKRGLDRCMKLMEIEEDFGFRSCFFFVPEKYFLPPELHDELVQRGFEIGVHGLKHDGRLFNSRRIFQRRAIKINQYLQEWNSCGFRSPSMHHNFDWIYDLDIEYDSSTFDTDPFEPQPVGTNTIFPIYKPINGDRKSYIELPYTLPQDLTLFVLMQEKGIDLWKKKLDWIVRHNGLALLLTHPDYMNFGEGNGRSDEYTVKHYYELLKYIKFNYEGQYWHVLPKVLSSFWKSNF